MNALALGNVRPLTETGEYRNRLTTAVLAHNEAWKMLQDARELRDMAEIRERDAAHWAARVEEVLK